MKISRRTIKIAIIFSILLLAGNLYRVLLLVRGFVQEEASSIGIIGGADGPTAMYTLGKLYPNLGPQLILTGISAAVEFSICLFVLIWAVRALIGKNGSN